MKNPLRVLIALTTLLASLGASLHAQAQDVKPGDKVAGEKKAAMCIGCHGIPEYRASFPEVYKVPMIAGQNAKYIVSALGSYKKGDRRHPTMRAIATTLTDQDMADLAAFYETETAGSMSGSAPVAAVMPAPSAAVAELLKKGNCISCHGDNFSKPIDPSYPKLAGQHADYLFFALKAYQTEKNPQVGRNNAIMVGMAKPYTKAELKVLTAYLGSLPSELKTVAQSRFR